MAPNNSNSDYRTTSLGEVGGEHGGKGTSTSTSAGSALDQLSQLYSDINNDNNTASNKREHSPHSDYQHASDTGSGTSGDRDWVRRVRGSKRARREAPETSDNPNRQSELADPSTQQQQSDEQDSALISPARQQREIIVVSDDDFTLESRALTADGQGVRDLIELIDDSDDTSEDESEHDSNGSAPMDSSDGMPGSGDEYDDNAGGAGNKANGSGEYFNNQDNDEAYDADDQSGEVDHDDPEDSQLPSSNGQALDSSGVERSATPPPPPTTPHRGLAPRLRANFDIYASDSDLSSLGASPSPPASPTFVRLERELAAPPTCWCSGWCACLRYKIFYASMYPGDGILTVDEARAAGVELPSQIHLSNRVLDAEDYAVSSMRESLHGRPGPQGKVPAGEVKRDWSWDQGVQGVRTPRSWVGGSWGDFDDGVVTGNGVEAEGVMEGGKIGGIMDVVRSIEQ